MRFPRSVAAMAVGVLVVVSVAIGGVADAKVIGPKKPGAPTSLLLVPAKAAVTASWSSPFSDGGSAITSYVVTATPGGATCATTKTTCTVNGLTSGKKVTVKVRAVNGVGPGKPAKATTVIPVGGNAYCGTKQGSPTTTKLMVVYEENTDASSIYGSPSAPNIDGFAAHCGSAQHYQALTHPSLPNYMASTSGLSYASSPWTSDCNPGGTCLTANDNIFHQVGASGWKAYAESMSANCGTSGSAYASRHNPAEYYTDVSTQCLTNDVPMGTTTAGSLHSDVVGGTLPRFSTVTPNLDDDMHDGTIQQADSWLAGWIPQITAGPDYQSGRLTILIVWDEGAGSGNTASTVAMIAMSPFTIPGTRSSAHFTHNSLLKAAEDITGVPELAGAATAGSLRTAFRF